MDENVSKLDLSLEDYFIIALEEQLEKNIKKYIFDEDC
jgi:hypothetical protein